MMKKIWFTWRHNGKRDYVIIDDHAEDVVYQENKKNELKP